jgi:hypothetical protein
MRVVYEFDPFELSNSEKPRGASRRDALNEIADYVKTEVLSYVSEGKSPVKGGEWKRSLSPEYKSIKEKISGSNFANMELTGDMLDALEARVTSRGTIQIGWFGGEQAAKADGHNNFSGNSTLPRRQSIPNADEGQTFRPDILRGMREIAGEFLPEE